MPSIRGTVAMQRTFSSRGYYANAFGPTKTPAAAMPTKAPKKKSRVRQIVTEQLNVQPQVGG